MAAYEEALVTTPRLLVRLTATGETRQARETARGDRLAGTAVRTAAEEFVPPNMDLTIATDELPPAEVAEQVIAALR